MRYKKKINGDIYFKIIAELAQFSPNNKNTISSAYRKTNMTWELQLMKQL